VPIWPLHQGLALEPTECVATVLGLAQIFREMGARTIAAAAILIGDGIAVTDENKQRSRPATVARPQRCARLGSAPICRRACVRRAPETAPARSAGRHRSPASPRRARAPSDRARQRFRPCPSSAIPSHSRSAQHNPIRSPLAYRRSRLPCHPTPGHPSPQLALLPPRVGCCIHRQRIWPLTAQRKKRRRCSRR
jgi:hypothetical protein